MVEERQIEHAATSRAWLRHTLEEIIGQIRRLLDVTGVSFLVVDWEAGHIDPAASWFASEAVGVAFRPVLSRPYEPARAGVTEAAIERQAPVLIERMEDWPGSEGLHAAAVREPRHRVRPAAVGLVQHVLVHLLPRAHERRAHPRRAGDRRLRARSGRSARRTCA